MQMTKTKQTPHGSSSSHRSRGMTTARFTAAKETVEAEEQHLEYAGGDESQESQEWPDTDDQQSKAATQGKGESSKSVGETGDQPSQLEGEATAPLQENPPAPTDPQPGTSKDPTNKPAADPTQDPIKDPTQDPIQDPTQDPTQNPEEDMPPDLTEYIKSYQQAGKQWLDRVLE